MKRKKDGWAAIGFTPNLIREEIEEENRRACKEVAKQEIHDLEKEKLEKEIELLNDRKRTIELSPPNSIIQQLAANPGSLLRWEVFSLDIVSGRAFLAGRYHHFNTSKPTYSCYLALLKKKVDGINDGEVAFEELIYATGKKDKEKVKQLIRNLRGNLGINNEKNPQDDVFCPTGKGYRLIIPVKV